MSLFVHSNLRMKEAYIDTRQNNKTIQTNNFLKNVLIQFQSHILPLTIISLYSFAPLLCRPALGMMLLPPTLQLGSVWWLGAAVCACRKGTISGKSRRLMPVRLQRQSSSSSQLTALYSVSVTPHSRLFTTWGFFIQTSTADQKPSGLHLTSRFISETVRVKKQVTCNLLLLTAVHVYSYTS